MKSGLPYNVFRNPNDWDRAPRAAAIAMAIAPSLFTAAGAAIGIGGLLLTTAISIGISAVTSWALNALAPKPDLSSSRGTLVNARDAVAPADFVYGEVRKGGIITFYESTGDENKYLHQVIVVAAHEVEELGTIYINDQVAIWSSSTGLISTAGSGDEQTDWGGKIRIRKHLGDQTTADSDLINETSATSAFIGKELAYLYVRYEYDQDVFANGLPLITVKVKGKKVEDPRNSTTAYSNNAALCIRDFITSKYGLEDTAIDEVSFAAAANECDEGVPLAGGGSEKRFQINGVVRSSESIGSVLGNMSTACAGTIFWGSGYWKLKVGTYTAPTKTLTLDDLRGPINLQTRVSIRDNFNAVRGTFNDSAQNYITADYPEITSPTFKAEDKQEEVALDLPLPFTTSASAAQRIAKLTLFRGREQMTISADFGLEAFGIEVGDIIAFDNPRYGFDEKEFEVVGWNFSANQEAGDLRVTLTLRETSAAAFDWNAEESDIIGNNTTLPVYTAGLDILGLNVGEGGRTQSDGTRVSTALLGWTAVQSSYVTQYEVQWKPTSDSSYATTYTTNNSIELLPIVDSVEYTFRVRAVSANGYRGAFSSITLTGGGDVTAPALPTNVSASGHFKYISLEWENPMDADLKYVEIWENTTNTSLGANKVGISGGDNFQRTNLGLSQTRYYFLRSVDYSGNASGFTAGVSATTTYLDDPDFANGIYTLFTDQGLYAIEDVTSLPAGGTFEGEKVFNRTDGKLYQWTGSAWELVVADVASGSITETKIADNAITTPKLQAGSITGDKITSNTITGNKITANTITGGLLSTSGIITNSAQINNAVVTNAKIADAAITNTKIGTAAITSAKIADASITNAKIGSLSVTTLKIANQAVSNTGFASGSANISTSWTNVTSLVLSTEGSNQLIIQASGSATGFADVVNVEGFYRILVGSSVIYTSQEFNLFDGGGGRIYPLIPAIRLSTSSSGATGITIQARRTSGQTLATTFQLLATELKK